MRWQDDSTGVTRSAEEVFVRMADNTRFEGAFAELSRLIHAGDSHGASEAAAAIAERADEPGVVASAMAFQIGQLHNAGHTRECPHLLDQAFAMATRAGDHSLLATLYALAASVATEESFERCIRYLVSGHRELDRVEQPNQHTTHAARDLAVAYSYAGFHSEAVALAERAYEYGQQLELHNGDHTLPEVGVRHAVCMDQRGDTVTAIELLQDVLTSWRQRVWLTELWSVELYYYCYAAARLRVLGQSSPETAVQVPPGVNGWEASDLRVLTDACVAIADNRVREALDLLDSRTFSPYTLGSAEVPRLRALAHTAAGDLSAAWTCDREAARLSCEAIVPMTARLLESTKAQLDHEVLRHTVERYAREALTDPLTGLPNRRHCERWVDELNEVHIPAVVGLLDLDNFHTVNNVHGHLGGDLVLQRVATTLARTVRGDDFVARYGGDEFVVVLPRIGIEEGQDIGVRLSSAIESEDWDAIVPGTPVSITIGWATLPPGSDLGGALDRADHQMLRSKPVTGPAARRERD